MATVRRLTARGPRLAVLMLLCAVVAAGCSDDPDAIAPAEAPADDDAAAEAADDDAGEDDTAADDAPADDATEDGICALLDGVDVAAAFAGTLTLGAPTSTTPDNCVLAVEGAEGAGVFIRTFGVDFYEQRVAAAESYGGEVRNPDLGQGAVLLGNADLTVLADEETALLVGAEAFFIETEAPSDEIIRAGVLTVAEQVLANR